jgi:hypothetical protein
MIKLLAHRGKWKTKKQQNTKQSIIESIKDGFGVETDLRDRGGRLVIAHDLPDSNSWAVESCFPLFPPVNSRVCFALNIKSDGLHGLVESFVKQLPFNYFLFDMSIPDTLGYLRKGLNVFTRQSEYEPEPAFYEDVKGVWLDCFDLVWYNADLIEQHAKKDKEVVIVSSELHGRPHLSHWALLKEWGVHKSDNYYLCTDFPDQAEVFFYE